MSVENKNVEELKKINVKLSDDMAKAQKLYEVRSSVEHRNVEELKKTNVKLSDDMAKAQKLYEVRAMKICG